MNTIPSTDGKLFTTAEGRRVIMERYGDDSRFHSRFPYSGVNEDGEKVLVSISTDSIVIRTYQTNGWIRVNYYDAEGYPDGETFDGRWQ